MAVFVPPVVVAAEPRPAPRPRIAPRLLPEPERHRRVSKSAPLPTDPLGILLEEWLAEQKVRNTFDGE